MLAKRGSGQFLYSALEGQRGSWIPRPTKCRHLVLPSVAPPCRPPCAVPTRPARCVSRFWTRQVFLGQFVLFVLSSIEFHLSSPKPRHTTGGLGRQGAGRKAGRGDAGQNKVPTLRSPLKPTAPLAIRHNVNNFSERYFARTNKK